ncbi:MAG: malate synthase A, partial [Candidatus Limnocylindria bacterium]
MTHEPPAGVAVIGQTTPHGDDVLTADALAFVASLHRSFNPRRLLLLADRSERQARFDAGELPDFLPNTAHVRGDPDWQVAPAPADLEDRRVEITGPVEPKMMINALNSGAKVFMADFEDASSPTWQNILEGQRNVTDAIERTIRLETTERTYALNETIATLVV